MKINFKKKSKSRGVVSNNTYYRKTSNSPRNINRPINTNRNFSSNRSSVRQGVKREATKISIKRRKKLKRLLYIIGAFFIFLHFLSFIALKRVRLSDGGALSSKQSEVIKSAFRTRSMSNRFIPFILYQTDIEDSMSELLPESNSVNLKVNPLLLRTTLKLNPAKAKLIWQNAEGKRYYIVCVQKNCEDSQMRAVSIANSVEVPENIVQVQDLTGVRISEGDLSIDTIRLKWLYDLSLALSSREASLRVQTGVINQGTLKDIQIKVKDIKPDILVTSTEEVEATAESIKKTINYLKEQGSLDVTTRIDARNPERITYR